MAVPIMFAYLVILDMHAYIFVSIGFGCLVEQAEYIENISRNDSFKLIGSFSNVSNISNE